MYVCMYVRTYYVRMSVRMSVCLYVCVSVCMCMYVCMFDFGATARSGSGLLIHKVSRSHNDAPQSVELLWMSDQFVVEAST
jgi:hypothetical protein